MKCSNSVLIIKLISKVEININLLELVYSNICELNDILTRGGNRYFITFIDDCSKYTYVYLIKHKYQAFQMFKNYKLEVENQKRKKIKIIVSNKGGEYFSMKFSSFCEENRIIHQTSAPYTPK